MLMAAWITGSFAVAGIGAWYLLNGQHEAFGRRTVSMGTGFAVVLIAMQVFLGDLLYGKMLQHQPSKMQAGEGFWEKQVRISGALLLDHHSRPGAAAGTASRWGRRTSAASCSRTA
jgi:cytochrome bd-type quinol oxidase subunit 1